MVIRLRDPLAEGALDLAAQAALAPTLEAGLPAAWDRCWVVAQPHVWNGGTWAPGLRTVALRLFNAGPVDAVFDRLEVDGDWLEPNPRFQPLVVQAHGKAVEVNVALRPQGMVPGMLTGALRLGGPGWGTTVPLQLYVPFAPQPWWQDESLTLATHVQEHRVRLVCIGAPGADARGELFFAGTPVAAPAPAWHDGRWEWNLALTSGEYSCTLVVDGKAVELQAGAPHRWEWERAGQGRLTVGAAEASTTLTNVGEAPLDVQLESDAPWLDVAPAKLTLRPGQAEAVTLRDRLAQLEQGAATGHVRVLALPDRKLWAELPVSRAVTAAMGLPVLAPASLTMSLVGRRASGGVLHVTNVGGEALGINLELPTLARADWQSGSLAPGETRHITVVPENPGAGERAEGSGFIRLHTDSVYPALRTLQVPVTIRRLFVVADPAAIDLGKVAPHGSQYSPWLKLRLSSGAPGQFDVRIPPDAARWLEFRGERFVVRNKRLQELSGAVSTTVTVQEAQSGAETQVPVKAFLQRPQVRHSGDVLIKRTRPGRRLQQTVRIWDEGQGLQVREVRNMLPWLRVVRTAEGLDLQIETGRRERTLAGVFTVDTNDPDQPRVSIAVKVRVRPTRWDRLRYDLEEARLHWLLWAVPLLLVAVMAAAGGYWWFATAHSPSGHGGGPANANVAAPH